MTRYLLDTNIISNTIRLVPSRPLVGWMAEQADEDLFVASLTVAEIRRGILQLPAGKRRSELEKWFAGPGGPGMMFMGRVLPFDERAGLIWAGLMAEARKKGRSRSALDTIIAATAVANECVIVTNNERDFEGLRVINPLRGR